MTLREKIARTSAFWHGQKMTFKPPGDLMQTVASQAGYGHFGDAANRYADAKWEQYLPAADAVLALLSDPANYTDEMREVAVGVYEDQPRLSDMRVMARAIAAAFTAASKEPLPPPPKETGR